MRRGYQTTEFWIVIAVVVGEIAVALEGSLPPSVAGVVAGLGVAAFAVSRGLAKLNNPGLNVANDTKGVILQENRSRSGS